MGISAPTLGPDEWVTSSLKQADYIISWFLASEKSQSTIYTDVKSFAYLVAYYHNEPTRLADEVSNALSSLFSRYFSEVVPQVLTINQDNANFYNLHIYLEFKLDDGTLRNLSEIMMVENSSFSRITNVINQ